MTGSELIQVLLASGWSEHQARLGIRANSKCEYCGMDLLGSIHAYDAWERDHIIPGRGDDLSNVALACRLCNKMKKNWRLPAGLSPGGDRSRCVEAAKAHLEPLRQAKEEKLEQAKALISRYRAAAAAAGS